MKIVMPTLVLVSAFVFGAIAMEDLPATPVTIQDALTLCQKWVSDNRMYSGNYNITSAILKTTEEGTQWWEVTYTKRHLMKKGDKPGFMVFKVTMEKTVDRIRNE